MSTLPLAGACLKAGVDSGGGATTVTLVAGTVPDTAFVGSLTLQPGSGLDLTAPGALDVVTYKNTTARNFTRVGIALVPLTAGTGTLACNPLQPILTDSSLAVIAPGTTVTLATGILPRSLLIYVTQALEGTKQWVPALGGRWTGLLTEYRTGATTNATYPIVAVTDGTTGQFTANTASGSTTPIVLNGTLAIPHPTKVDGYPNNCDLLYHGDPASMNASLVADTLQFWGKSTLDAAASGSTAAPDSFRVRLVRR